MRPAYSHRAPHRCPLQDTLFPRSNASPFSMCSHSALGQQFWQLLSQWVWYIRLELGHQLEPEPVRIIEFAPAIAPLSPNPQPSSRWANCLTERTSTLMKLDIYAQYCLEENPWSANKRNSSPDEVKGWYLFLHRLLPSCIDLNHTL